MRADFFYRVLITHFNHRKLNRVMALHPAAPLERCVFGWMLCYPPDVPPEHKRLIKTCCM
jgi:hypothetical protein